MQDRDDLLLAMLQDVQRGQERTESRCEQIREELHGMRLGNVRIADRLDGIEQRVEALEGPVAEYRQIRGRIGGLVISGGVVASAIGTIWTLCGGYIRDHFSWR